MVLPPLYFIQALLPCVSCVSDGAVSVVIDGWEPTRVSFKGETLKGGMEGFLLHLVA